MFPVSTQSPLCGAGRIVRAIYKVDIRGMDLLAADMELSHTSANAIAYFSAASLADKAGMPCRNPCSSHSAMSICDTRGTSIVRLSFLANSNP